MSAKKEIRKSEGGSSDIEELREVFGAITEFIKSIKGEVKDLIVLSMDALNGAKLGEEISKFYKSLIEGGVPEEVAREMTREYFHKRLEAVPNLSNILSKIGLGGKEFKKMVKALKPSEREEEESREGSESKE